MYNKKHYHYIVTHVITLFLLLLPIESSSALIDNVEKDTKASSIYISSQYKPSIFHFRNFSIQESHSKKNLEEFKKNAKTNLSNILKSNAYNIQFQDNTTSFSGTIGYFSRGLRLEAEGCYQEFNVINSNDSLIINSNKYYSRVHNANYATTMNSKLSIASIMVNTCYDISINNTSIVPYLCTGIGGDFVGLFNTIHFKFAYQGKVGVSYLINNNILLFSDIYYHKVMGNRFKNLYMQYVAGPNISEEIMPILAKLDIGYFGSEIGIRFMFN
ncbi:surface antigen family protein [Ehrlichia chaffeensis str. Liberty]|uniref:P44/Msp2 family outer membrane protein n=1 Tax=Ehrlichia chaffeensis TaxID=945 RepID=UPI000444C2C0|nr:P44/Msp2 family outer membrane protein [Ehrlichia chaffeensis]AHX05152.1 surface antigen family protein [Ehrlichia chaffeensis str. Jax]AHX06141.1 surface antigen family protein [Ehrlichia chaffeensis str. Liberty]